METPKGWHEREVVDRMLDDLETWAIVGLSGDPSRTAYEIALALACGRTPEVRRRSGAFAAAASFPLRAFEPVRVLRVPSREEIDAAERAHPGSLIWVECHEGERLLDSLDAEDGASQRYAVLNLGGRDRKELEECRASIERMLAFEFDPRHARSGARAR